MNLTYIYLIIVMSYCILILLIPRQPQEELKKDKDEKGPTKWKLEKQINYSASEVLEIRIKLVNKASLEDLGN